eukprot:TRINITY_DN4124_c0_g1_i2.p2 TRINITY_DN4124_c0_g1~~TRINITY_DN4124_c0_g1_i2.p2  ORF type:complete len:104 (-),score=18.05 TRINITY_DN4124_c0_g1_i2:288-599(-)
MLGKVDDPTPEQITEALIKTIHVLVALVYHVEEEDKMSHQYSSLNLAVSDGKTVVCSRFRDGPEEPPSLYYSFLEEYKVSSGVVHVIPSEPEYVNIVVFYRIN